MNAFAMRLATQLAPALPRWLWLRAMAELGWRSRSTLFGTFIIAAGTLAASQYGSTQYHCAISPYSGTEHSWGISLTQDSRDSDFYSGCQSNRGGGTRSPESAGWNLENVKTESNAHTMHIAEIMNVGCSR